MTQIQNFEEAEQKTSFEDGVINLPTGKIPLKTLRAILNTIPFEIDFIDENDHFIYFTDSSHKRIHDRALSSLGNHIMDCHPPQAKAAVEMILTSFHDGSADHYEQWFPMGDRTCYINYYALRDEAGTYLGCIEFTGDIKRIQGFRGVRTPHNSDKSA